MCVSLCVRAYVCVRVYVYIYVYVRAPYASLSEGGGVGGSQILRQPAAGFSGTNDVIFSPQSRH